MKCSHLSGFAVSLVLALCCHVAARAQSTARRVQIDSTGAELTESRRIFTVTATSRSQWLVLAGHLDEDPERRVSNSAELLETRSGRVVVQRLAATMRVRRWGHRATRLTGGEVLICAGSPDPGCEMYLPKSRKFAAAGNLAVARSAPAQVMLASGRVLIAGGYNKGDPALGSVLAEAEIYDPHTKAIASAAPMQHARAGHELFVFGTKTYAVGGLTESSRRVEVFDERQGQWRDTSMQLPYSLKDFRSVVRGGQIYLLGGTRADGNSTDRVVRMDIDAGTVTEMPGRLSEPREDLALCISAAGNRVMTFGGEVKGNGRNGAHSAATEVITFDPFAVVPSTLELPRDDAQTIQVGKDCLVVGGTNQEGEVERAIVRVNF